MQYSGVGVKAIMVSMLVVLGGCQQPAGEAALASGKVVTVGKAHLVLKDASHVMFVPLQETDREHLKFLKKDDEVTLLGKEHVAGGDPTDAQEVGQVVLSDGTHIPIGQE